MRKMMLVMFSLVLVSILAACSGTKVDDTTAEKYITQAEEVVTLLNETNYNDVHAKFDSEMKVGLPVSNMEELTPVINESGDFEAIDKSSVEEQDGLYVVVLAATYSEKNRVYTITFNADDEIAGLFIK